MFINLEKHRRFGGQHCCSGGLGALALGNGGGVRDKSLFLGEEDSAGPLEGSGQPAGSELEAAVLLMAALSAALGTGMVRERCNSAEELRFERLRSDLTV